MPYIDIIPKLSSSGAGWKFSNFATAVSAYAELSSGSTSVLRLYGTAASIPKDCSISGIEVFYNCKSDVNASGLLDFNFFTSKTFTELADDQPSITVTTTPTASAVGGASNLWNYDLIRQDINANNTFGISISPDASVACKLYVNQVSIRVHYTGGTYLVGSRSRFSNRIDTEFDVVMNGNVPDEAASLIKRKQNSVDSINQINSEDVNLLGDSLYRIEQAIIENPNSIRAINTKKLYSFSITISGSVASGSPGYSILYFRRSKVGTTYTNTLTNADSTLSGLVATRVPYTTKTITCPYVSAIGWLGNGSASLAVKPYGCKFFAEPNESDYIFECGFILNYTSYASLFSSISDYDTLVPATSPQADYIGSNPDFRDRTMGTFTIKLLAIGKEY